MRSPSSAFGDIFGHMAREASLHPISDKLMGNDSGHFMLVSSSQLIGRANRWGNCLGLADSCDHGGNEMKLSDWVLAGCDSDSHWLLKSLRKKFKFSFISARSTFK
ncbi:hypothetical protein TNCV_678461 [Trichonephila clavipes]|nr:hypothetical protein TNCV_678461 [Trichonephila clavipes]